MAATAPSRQWIGVGGDRIGHRAVVPRAADQAGGVDRDLGGRAERIGRAGAVSSADDLPLELVIAQPLGIDCLVGDLPLGVVGDRAVVALGARAVGGVDPIDLPGEPAHLVVSEVAREPRRLQPGLLVGGLTVIARLRRSRRCRADRPPCRRTPRPARRCSRLAHRPVIARAVGRIARWDRKAEWPGHIG